MMRMRMSFWMATHKGAFRSMIALTALVIAAAVFMATRSPEAQAHDCVIVDLSNSVSEMKDEYTQRFNTLVADAAKNHGTLCLIVARGNPLATTPWVADFSATNDGSTQKDADTAKQVVAARTKFASILNDPPVQKAGSALFEALSMTERYVESGGRIVLFSDGIQYSDLVNIYEDQWDLTTTGGRQKIINSISDLRMIPQLSGVTLEVPEPLAQGREGTGLSPEEQAGVREMWFEWATRANARLEWG